MRRETEAALMAAGAAIELMRKRLGAEEISSKGGRDLATGTDVGAEDAVRAELLRRFPSYPVVGEERGGESEIGDGSWPYWLVDPICGTRNFASDLPLYCVNVALVERGRVTVGVVGDGATGDRYVAELGQRARVLTTSGERPIRASDDSVTVSFDVGGSGSGGHYDEAADMARAVILANRWYVRMLGSSLAVAYLASGRFSAHLVSRIDSPVHSAAGALLAAEAGCVVTDVNGRPWDVTVTSFLAAATPELHRELLQLVGRRREMGATTGPSAVP